MPFKPKAAKGKKALTPPMLGDALGAKVKLGKTKKKAPKKGY